MALTDEDGAITSRFQYGPYGELVAREGESETPFLFNGRDGVMTDICGRGISVRRSRVF